MIKYLYLLEDFTVILRDVPPADPEDPTFVSGVEMVPGTDMTRVLTLLGVLVAHVLERTVTDPIEDLNDPEEEPQINIIKKNKDLN